ncbi:MAG TPA: hypothetical protein DIU15_08250 [Deltaproteobacteria bacterium]|nr:hypothetical protein [Deltaproteobacteria bacterium]HCP46016.1 hypothetical protein [Deltaproteobacteria bacterium]
MISLLAAVPASLATLFGLGAAIVVLIVGLAAIVAFVVGIYNRLIRLKNRYENAFAQIDVQLKRRYDLIPNLVETVKGYMAHEKDTLDAVISARSAAMSAGAAASAKPGDPSAMGALSGAEGMLGAALGRLFALSEAYPDLKANQNVLSLQEELGSTENRIAFARQAYNDGVTAYNTAREIFPNNIIAGMFSFEDAALFEVSDEAEKQAPAVSFS